MLVVFRFLKNYSLVYGCIFFLMNLITFALFRADKKKAEKKAFRIPESNLLGFSAAFGGLGGLLGMILFHHKTRKPKFFVLVPLFAIVQTVFTYLIFKLG